MSKAKIFITGGAGFIGSNIAASYLKKGHSVTIYDNLSRPNVEHNLNWLKKDFDNQLLTVKVADVRDAESLAKEMAGQEVVFHMAGQTAVTTSVKDPVHDFEVNARGTINVLEAVRLQAPDAIVLTASTNKVYGNLSDFELSEGDDRYLCDRAANEEQPLDFYSPYGCSKGTADQYTHDYHRIYGLKTIVFRQSCIYGTHQFGVEDQGWLAHFAAQTINKKQINIFGNGKQVRDALFIEDLVEAYEKAVEKIEVTAGEVYNIGGGPQHTISLIELIEQLTQLAGYKPDLKFDKERPGDQKYYVSDVSKAMKDFGWQPTTNLDNGLKRLYLWLADFLAHNA